MVVTFAPSACTANTVQDLALRPSMSTVHAPHWLVSQPTCVPVRLRCSRKKCTRSVRGSTCALRTLPLTVMATCSIGAPILSQPEAPTTDFASWGVEPVFRGFVKDEQGVVLPGITVTAHQAPSDAIKLDPAVFELRTHAAAVAPALGDFPKAETRQSRQ